MTQNRIERPAFDASVGNVEAAAQWATRNWEALTRYHARPALVFTEHDTGWEDTLSGVWSDWVQGDPQEFSCAGELWDAFCATHDDGRVRLVIACRCGGRGTCTKCGPVRGKIVGDVYVIASGTTPASPPSQLAQQD